MGVIEDIEREQMKQEEIPDFWPGDTVRVQVLISEGGRERMQAFEGVVLRRSKPGSRESFTVRRVSHNVGVERTFLTHSPSTKKIEVLRRGKARKGKLYYLRGRVGKSARLQEQARE
ncbi:MAG: 50S ribosomal protein L19 [Armatimonadota bacterium]